MPENPLQHEKGIDWGVHETQYEYVRVTYRETETRDSPVPLADPDDKRIGYGVLNDDVPEQPSGGFRRRVFFLTSDDRAFDPDGEFADSVPSSAVDPRTLAPGKEGRVTSVARGLI